MSFDAQSTDGDDLNQIISVQSVQSEASILQKASEEIQRLVESVCKKPEETIYSKNKTKEKSKSADNLLRTKFENQVRTGEITPFQAERKEINTKKTLGRTLKESTQLLDLEKYLFQQAELAQQKKLQKRKLKAAKNEKEENTIPVKKRKLLGIDVNKDKKINEKAFIKSNSKKTDSIFHHSQELTSVVNNTNVKNRSDHNKTLFKSLDEPGSSQVVKKKAEKDKLNKGDDTGSEYIPSDDFDSDEEFGIKKGKKKKNSALKQINNDSRRVFDDGDENLYKQRVEDSGYRENEPLHKVDNCFKVPLRIWKNLYKYQKVAVRWLWELHSRNLGGLLGDEMGLGKTVQVIAFLSGMDCSELLSDGGRFRGLGPTLIVCPATLMEQWVQHFHDWWPTIRVMMLHQSSTFQGDIEDLLHTLEGGGILIVSYSGVVIHKESLVKFKWHYIILDEGHKIRNPEAKVTKAVKGFLTPHRVLLTGSPMQNSLKELWSLFDFILPGKLGTLAAFMEHCAGPITRGGYSNATHLQEATALQVATMLKNAITPYMLRRTKYDVQYHVNLPDKNEQVLFCSLTGEQRQLYKQFLRSDDVSYVIHDKREGGMYRAKLLVALTSLRKICNHPDLYLYTDDQYAESEEEEEEDRRLNEIEMDKFGHWKRSGKMTVVRSLLKIWKKQGHRVLLFTQSKQMLHILESLVLKEHYTYMRMDGTTPMAQRQMTISKFNKDPSYFVFLLTTRVGGLGVNLTGGNRVIIYDPDWNPATDAQARERAWRIGQNKNVTVYRLITAGTIEEKIYHRQIFKILLSNKVLEDPRQRRLFHTTDLTELFNLNEPINGGSSESDHLFRESKLSADHPNFTSSKVEAMKKLAASLSKKISEKMVKVQYVKDKDNEESKFNNNKDDLILTNKIEEKVEKWYTNQEKNKSEGNINTKELKNLNEENLQREKNEKKIEKDTESKCSTDETQSYITDKEIEEGEIVDNSVKSFKKKNLSNRRPSKEKFQIKEENDQCRKKHKKHKKHKKSKSENTISAIFEGEHISCLIGQRLGKKDPEPVSTEDDQYVLSKLFSKAAVSSAFQHESVLSNAVLNPLDETPLQRAAKETASEKMDCIRQSRKWCWKPCWDKPFEEEFYKDSSSE